MDESYTSNSLLFYLYSQRHQVTSISTSTVHNLDTILQGVFIIYPGGENCRQLLHRRFLPLDPISGHLRLHSLVHLANLAKVLWRSRELRRFFYYRWILKMWEFVIFCLEISCLCIYFSIKGSALSPFFPLDFRGFTEASLESEELQCFFYFAAVGVSQSIQEVGVYQPWPEWECWNSGSCCGWNSGSCRG